MTVTQWYVRTKNGASGPYSTQQIKEFALNGKLPRQANIAKTPDGPWTPAGNARGLFPDPPQTDEAENPDDDQMRASDFVPDVIKNSATAISSAASGFTNSIVTKIKKIDAAWEAKAKAKEEAAEAEKAEAAEAALIAASKPAPVTQVDHNKLNLFQGEPIKPVQSQLMHSKKCPFCTAEVPADAIKCRYCAEFLDGRNLNPQQPVATVAAATQHVYIQTRVAKWSPGVAAGLSLIIPGLGQIYKTQIFNGLLWMIMVPIGYLFFIIPGLFLHICCVIGASQGDPYK
jgi:hypothetical protein